MRARECDVAIKHCPNPNRNYEKGTARSPRNNGPTTVPTNYAKVQVVAATATGLWFLDVALCLSQHGECATCSQFGIGPFDWNLIHTAKCWHPRYADLGTQQHQETITLLW